MSNRTDGDPAAHIGQLVRDMRIDAGLTQDDLAAELSSHLSTPVHKTMVSKIENGSRSISLREAVALSDVLGTSVRELGAAYRYVGIGGMEERVIHDLKGLEQSLNNSIEEVQSLIGASVTLLELIAAADDHGVLQPQLEREGRAAQDVYDFALEAQNVLIALLNQARDQESDFYRTCHPARRVRPEGGGHA